MEMASYPRELLPCQQYELYISLRDLIGNLIPEYAQCKKDLGSHADGPEHRLALPVSRDYLYS